MNMTGRILLICVALTIIMFYDQITDAWFLTKNSIKELRQHFQGESLEFNDIDYPLNNMVNSILPIDSVISFNATDSQTNSERLHQILGRYASFSPILNHPLNSSYMIFPGDGCSVPDPKVYSHYTDKVLIVLRGNCTFVEKVEHLLQLNPTAVIIANDEPMRGLITMYSSSFNNDRSLVAPIIFITNESYQELTRYDSKVVHIYTASLGSWLNILLSMVLSPPLLILFFYSLIQLIQNFKRMRKNKCGQKIVKNLPVYIYNKNHLIDSKKFFNYLNLTGQTNDAIDNSSIYSESLPINKPTPSSSNLTLNNFVINGYDVKHNKSQLNILIMHDDFYPAFKCSICLERFKPLKSRVLILDCKHFFHETCLSNWLINFKRSCPLCNYTINQSSSLLAGQATYGSIDMGQYENDIESTESVPSFDGTDISEINDTNETINEPNETVGIETNETEINEPNETETETETNDINETTVEPPQPKQSSESVISDNTFITTNTQFETNSPINPDDNTSVESLSDATIDLEP